ncbi:MAG: copper chaperone PCu(A)C [Anaerolineae bacterium]|nr:copper chaperone PCu(A)C [Anaerolineae bacterium]
MRKLVFALLLLSLLPIGATAAQESTCNALLVGNVWARASMMVAGNSAVFGTLANLTESEDTLVGASTEVAEVVEIHESSVDADGVMSMNPLPEGLNLMAGQVVTLEPGGLHIMLINLQKDLVAGETFELTLEFENAGSLAVPVMIQEMTEEMGGHNMGGMEATEEASMGGMEAPPSVHVLGECSGIQIAGAWARPSVAPNSAVYATIFNLTEEEDTLVGGSVAAAEVVEIHDMTMSADGVMSMFPVEGGLKIPAGGMAQLKPGSLHVMLINLSETLDAGNTLEVTLTFANAGDITLTVPIEDRQAMMDMSEGN